MKTSIDTGPAKARPRVWFNKNLSSTSHVIARIREACLPGEAFDIYCTHPWSQCTVAPVADYFEVEPAELSYEDYSNWCLEFARKHDIDVFIPRNYVSAIAARRELFEAQGVTLILTGDEETLRLIKNKGLFYEAVGQDIVPQPVWRVVNNAAEFAEAFTALSARHNKVCYKPTEGIGGKGFRVITLNEPPIISAWDGKQISIEYDEALVVLGARTVFPQLMMMEYLPGQERSTDCLAQNGKLLVAITRLKSFDGKEELLEDNPQLFEYCRAITAKMKLDGLYNVQFMASASGEQYLLEVNPRTSGGVHYGARSGVCLPYWAIRLALGTATAEDIPSPQLGIRVSRATREVIR